MTPVSGDKIMDGPGHEAVTVRSGLCSTLRLISAPVPWVRVPCENEVVNETLQGSVSVMATGSCEGQPESCDVSGVRQRGDRVLQQKMVDTARRPVARQWNCNRLCEGDSISRLSRTQSTPPHPAMDTQQAPCYKLELPCASNNVPLTQGS
ncbi:hypothetical protein N656DRAFT_352287 [Canariomyces notabilis]|uniref:Uncharacterized protein n=1 Tax=Canariomyces notabilis TaxID=2074819 RepID=A0AAN6QFM7_9PEZI|nr:hypothetical protein N656DRAFT_352287 [Canariomyces arenarius]